MDDKTEEKDQRKSRVSIMGRSRSTRSQFKSFSRMRMRSHSYGFGSVHGVRPSERGSQLAPEFKRPQLMYLNTYQLSSFKPFDVTLVKAAVEHSLDDHFSDHTYHAQASPALALRVASEILKKIKSMAFNRYRIIAVVSVGQRRAQSFVNAVSFLWDHERDTYVDVHKETPSAFIQVTVFGVYLD
ncbi:dynein light chain Tctex-type 5-like [Aricia agestis]|uniref:dynein light chain Tctex-type 5-like n=1 Tax=Aricia agestis TaxID=91739 RepID=UPI001C205B7A|nr:dynein light chain Tctex-type 5-like [Aricia agestis]XP_041977290.1 dynein light chain Tctex-type 5-like [Aricia agestis]